MNPPDFVTVMPESDGVIRIGDPPIAATYIAEIDLPGITLLVDPSDPEPAAHALVHDVDACSGLVEALFGDEVAQAVSVGTVARVTPDPSAELLELKHLGRVAWLERYRPLPLDFDLLGLEALVARAQLADHEFVLHESGPLGLLVDLARKVRQSPELPLARELQELFRASLPFLPMVEAELPGLAHERELLLLQDEWGHAALSLGDLAWLASQLTPSASAQLGDGLDRGGTASLDWRRVPRALLPAAEASIRFSVSGGLVEVEMDGPQYAIPHPAVPRSTRDLPLLVASLRSSAWPVPLAEDALSFDPATGHWHGSLTIVPSAVELARAAPILDVDVRAAVVPWAAPNQRHGRADAARRWAARGIAARRLAAVSGDTRMDQVGSGSLRFSARLWEACERADRAERCRALAIELVDAPRLSLAERWLLSAEGGSASWVRPAGA